MPVKTKYPVPNYKNNNYDQMSGRREIDSLYFSGFCVTVKKPNNCCILKDSSVVLVTKIFKESQTIYLNIQKFTDSEPLFTEPFSSKHIEISVVKEEKLSVVKTIKALEIFKKCLKIKKDNLFVIIPLLHCNT